MPVPFSARCRWLLEDTASVEVRYVAFVRWRGRSAELLATVYERGTSRQVRLASLGARGVAPETRADVAERFPGIRVDWDAVDLALARGSLRERSEAAARDLPNDPLEWLHLQRRLHYWAALTERAQPEDARRLRTAATVLASWRLGPPAVPQAEPDPGWDPEPGSPDPGPFRGPSPAS